MTLNDPDAIPVFRARISLGQNESQIGQKFVEEKG